LVGVEEKESNFLKRRRLQNKEEENKLGVMRKLRSLQ
jgi:hypothetical protein